MRKPTRSEAVFLAVTLTAATLLTVEVIPKVVESYKIQSTVARTEFKKKASTDSKDAFWTGLIIGLGVGAIGTTKLIADKINNP
ncbi:hypothetical protein [Microcoleus sp. herbarium14]|uniref:hypothetical protein n=1 Tax=Microcoleus sp. herbarium14 TaxID=3055439 RepID=UPI002FD6F40B